MTLTDAAKRDIYRCIHCSALNDAALNAWCLCAGGEQSLVCGRCGRCFCAAPTRWKLEFWQSASDQLTQRRHEERHSRSVFQPGEGKTVARPLYLLVDDDRLVHAIVARVLADFPGTLLHATDGRTGLQMAQRLLPDVVITDALLPRVDGRDIARTLKSDPGTAAIKVVVMTALYKGTKYRNEALREFRADDYIEKPVSSAALRRAIVNLLAGDEIGLAAAAAS